MSTPKSLIQQQKETRLKLTYSTNKEKSKCLKKKTIFSR